MSLSSFISDLEKKYDSLNEDNKRRHLINLICYILNEPSGPPKELMKKLIKKHKQNLGILSKEDIISGFSFLMKHISFNDMNEKDPIKDYFINTICKYEYLIEELCKINKIAIIINIATATNIEFLKILIKNMRSNEYITKKISKTDDFCILLVLIVFKTKDIELIYYIDEVVRDLANDESKYCKLLSKKLIDYNIIESIQVSILSTPKLAKILVSFDIKAVFFKLLKDEVDLINETTISKILSKILKMEIKCGKTHYKSLNCAWCDMHPKLYICTGCYMMRYCNKECQLKDWDKHKHICKFFN
jgi:hypothetical protein